MANQQPTYWIDLGYYGMRWLILALPKASYVVVAGEIASNEEGLAALGFRRHPRQAHWLRAGMPDPRAIKRAFPQLKWYAVEDPSAIVLRAPERAISTESGPRAILLAAADQQRTTVGKGVALVLGQLGLSARLLSQDGEVAVVRLDGLSDLRIQRAPAPVGTRAAIAFEQAQALEGVLPSRVVVSVDDAGHAHLVAGQASDGQAARFFAVLLANVRHATVLPPAAKSVAPATTSRTEEDAAGVGSGEPAPAVEGVLPVDAPTARMSVVVATPAGGMSAEVGISRWRRIGESADAQIVADVALVRADGATQRAVAVPVDRLPATDADVRALLLEWGRSRLLGCEYIEGPAAAAPPLPGVVSEAEQESDHAAVGGGRESGDAAGPADEPVRGDQEGDERRPRSAEDVSRAGGEESAGDGHGARARARRRTPIRRDDDALLFRGLSERPPNFRLIDADRVVRTSWNDAAAITRNLEALRALKRVERAGNVEVDVADRDALIRYVGWGGLPGVFAEGHALQGTYGEELQRLLGDDGIAAARASTVNAHFTSVPVIDAMWQAIERAGFTGGRVLEPGAGTGLFIARVPERVAAAARFVAVEKEPVSAGILRALYPSARIIAGGYEESPIPNDSMDLVIGNVPFGEFRVYDEAYKGLKASLHDYFIVKSLDKLKPGGVLAVITSTGTLDKQNPRLREAMYERADLVAARRLPNDAFAGNANTDVTADVVFFRKRKADEIAQPFDWRDLADLQGADGITQRVNAVFLSDRGAMLGHAVTTSSMYGGTRNTVTRRDPATREMRSIESVLQALATAPPEGIWAPLAGDAQPSDVAEVEMLDSAAGEFGTDQEGNFLIRNGRLGQVVNGAIVKATFRFKSDEVRVRAWIPVRDALKAVLRVQVEGPMDDEALRQAQASLTLLYDAAATAHGPVSTRSNRRALADDPDLDLLLAAEDYDEESGVATKTEVFTERTLNRRGVMPEVRGASDALLWCIDQYGSVIPTRIADAADMEWDACRDALRGQIFLDPDTGNFELAARYLSGNVRAKLRTATKAAETDPAFAENVEALTARLPSWVSAGEIDADLGQPWIPPSDVAAFIDHLYDVRRGAGYSSAVSVERNPVTAEWAVAVPKHLKAPKWATPRYAPSELVELALRGQMPKVFDKDDEGRSVLNALQTAIAIEKQKEIREEFGRWIWQDLERSQRLERIYNEKFRSHRSPDYSGIPMSVPGMAATRRLRPHQERGVLRIVMEPNTLLSHPVGFGKTATFVSAAVKLKSLQLANKTMVVVRKNTLYQAAAETKRWFPESRVLMIRSEDLNPKGRMQFWRRVQTRNADLILVTPEAFKRIRLPKDAEMAFLHEEISHVEMALAHEAKTAEQQGRPRTRQVKNLEKRRESVKTRLKELLNLAEKDDARVTLADLGIDALFVDEAQNYKNLQVHTREQMLGIPTAAAQRASDLASKVWFMQQNNKRVVFATGTPVVNTLAEIFNMQRYLSPQLLEDLEVQTFDAWVAQFGAPVASLEPDPGGAGFRTVRRLAEVRNVPELVAMFAQVTDAVAESSVDLGRPTPTFRTIVSPPTELQAMYRAVLTERVVTIRERMKRRSEPGMDNILAVLGDARRAALDLRTMYPGLPGTVAGSKLDAVIAEVASEHKATTDVLGTQLIFLDFGTPGKSAWNGYEEIREGLVALGVPREEVAFIHDSKTDQAKADLFRQVRLGRVRVLLGSTEKMGEGTNVQDLLVALHHVNAPFHPGAVIQRNGRAIRQGNRNKEVRINTYVTQGLLEDWNWHLVLLKERFIRQLMDGIAANLDGEGLARRMTEDPSASMSYEEIEAMASGDPLVKEKCGIDVEVKRLRMLRDGHTSTQSSIRYELQRAREHVEHNEAQLRWIEPMAAKVTPPQEGVPMVSIKGSTFTGEKAFVRAGDAVILAITAAAKEPWRRHIIGEVRGLTLIVSSSAIGPCMELVASNEDASSGKFRIDFTNNPIALVKRIETAADDVRRMPDDLRARIEQARQNVGRFQAEVDAPWPQEKAYQDLLARQRDINIELEARNAKSKKDPGVGISATVEFQDRLRLVGGDAMSIRAISSPAIDDDMLDNTWGGQSDRDDEEDAGSSSTPIAASAAMR